MSTAYLFPGQGSQSVGMLADVASEFSSIEQRYKEASDALGFDLWKLVQQGPDEELNQTHNTQPALLTASVALYDVAKEQGLVTPKFMAGHSLGEYSALVAAGALNFADAVKLVALRGEYMQQAVPAGKGAMAAVIGLDDDKVAKACKEAAEGQIVAPVNYNSPGQVVIAGEKLAVERAAEACRQAGAKRVLPLPVSVPSHCELMRPAAEQLQEALANVELKQPQTPVINNVDVTNADSVDAIRDALVRQLYSPVRWTETINYLAQQGVEQAYEVGPGKVLSGLNKRIVKTMNCDALNTVDAFRDAAKQ
ncbi:[Acyl-carrier-protein] S-malonyltransferase [Pseudidiomarina planktonica]|uniref:Malonyl CoA-acyl carrier protein transacylase n=1 Tax=Pseudidiomarina planktonica TaxID=1323738 RepID=A0A1Y6ET05_9GAMM|nr:ACP S-malonyltransferase [Pseudidiomarina planktonica]RUO65338.1 [acyl-carrier-protein] S-malonyltransferase [Pseudidiomarina planktonica]SMQ65426.1 [Acyl-carrier-protein] S-malonyltransferase [Pseudidiomarina planktonica]